MLKKLFLLVLVAAPLSMFAQEKIAYINTQEIFTTMPEFAEVQKQLEVKGAKIQEQAASIEDNYTALVEKFSNDTTTVTASIVADRQKQLEQLQERYQTFLQSSKADFEQEQDRAFAPIRQKMQDAIKQVGDEHGFTYIADSAVFMYISPSATDANKLVKSKLGIK